MTLNLQTENYMENLRPAVKGYIAKNKTEFSECVDKSGHVEFVDENPLYILGHTDNDKDRLQYPGQQIWLALTQFQTGLVR